MKKKIQTFLAKPLHGQFCFRNTAERDEKSWELVKKGKLKKVTQGLYTAAQDQALPLRTG